MSSPQILGIGTANPPIRLTQEQCFHAAGYASERVRRIFLNSDIEHRHFYFGSTLNREESSDQLNERYLSGAIKTGCQAIVSCLQSARASVKKVDFLAVCSCTGYVCPDVGSRLISTWASARTCRGLPSLVSGVPARFLRCNVRQISFAQTRGVKH